MSNIPDQKPAKVSLLSPSAPAFEPQMHHHHQQQLHAHTHAVQQQQHVMQQHAMQQQQQHAMHQQHQQHQQHVIQQHHQQQQQQQQQQDNVVITSRQHIMNYKPVSPQGEHEKYLTTRKRGMVKWFDNEKGYGFLMPDDPQDRQDVFVHQTMIAAETRDGQESFRSLKEKETVEFDFYTDEKGRRRCTRVFLPGGQKFPFQERPESFEVIPRMRSGSYPGKETRRQSRQRSLSANGHYDVYNGHDDYQTQRYHGDGRHYEDAPTTTYGGQLYRGYDSAYPSDQLPPKVIMHTPTPSRRDEQTAADVINYSTDPHEQALAQQSVAVSQLRTKDPYTFHNFLPDTHRSMPLDIAPRTMSAPAPMPSSAHHRAHQSAMAMAPPTAAYAPQHHTALQFPAAYPLPPSPHLYSKDLFMSPFYGFSPSQPGSAFPSRSGTPYPYTTPPSMSAAITSTPPRATAASTMPSGLGAVESATVGVGTVGAAPAFTVPHGLNISLKMPPPAVGYPIPLSPVGSLYGSPLATPIVTPRAMHALHVPTAAGQSLPVTPPKSHATYAQAQPVLANPRPVMPVPTNPKAFTAPQNVGHNMGTVETSSVIAQIETAAALNQPPTYNPPRQPQSTTENAPPANTAPAGGAGAPTPHSLVPNKHYKQPAENGTGAHAGANSVSPSNESQVREENADKYRIEVTEHAEKPNGAVHHQKNAAAKSNAAKKKVASNSAVIQDPSPRRVVVPCE